MKTLILRLQNKPEKTNLLVRTWWLFSMITKVKPLSTKCLQKLLWMLNNMFQFWKICDNSYREIRHELVENWTLHHDNARRHVTISTKQDLSKWDIKVTPHPSVDSRSRSMRFLALSTLKLSSVAEHFMHFWIYFSSAEFLNAASWKKAFLDVWKTGLNYATVTYNLRKEYFVQKWFTFYLKNISVVFLWLCSQFLWNIFSIER